MYGNSKIIRMLAYLGAIKLLHHYPWIVNTDNLHKRKDSRCWNCIHRNLNPSLWALEFFCYDEDKLQQKTKKKTTCLHKAYRCFDTKIIIAIKFWHLRINPYRSSNFIRFFATLRAQQNKTVRNYALEATWDLINTMHATVLEHVLISQPVCAGGLLCWN